MFEGKVVSINISGGGVPKRRVREAAVDIDGLSGDVQRNLKYHGGPLRAVSLYSVERIVALQDEGHPIEIGAIGENLTIAGLDWVGVTPGATLEIGATLLEITKYADPCKTIAGSFRGADFTRVSQKRFPGWSRVYARVVRPGTVRIEDKVLLDVPSARGLL